MAKKIITTIYDDIDDTEGAEPIAFGFQGTNYEIDLGTKNRTRLEKALQPFMDAGRVVRPERSTSRGKTTRHVPNQRGPAHVDGDQNRAIRDWAQSKGIDVSGRGRIARSIVDQYHAEAGRK